MAKDGTIKINTELDSSKAQNAMSKFSSLAQGALKGVAVAVGTVGTAMTAMAGYAIKVGSDFESGMSKVSTISGATGSDLEALSDKAKEMGAKTKFSATEAASAFEYMAMAGWKTEDMLNGIEGVMNLAAASGEDLATTSDIVTDALTAFGLSASDSSHFADVLAAASSNANTNVSMMGETFKYVAPVAGALGFSAEDTAVAIGLMANSGIKAGQAGTALRAMMSRLAKPTDEVAATMDQLGISLTNSDGSMKSLNEVMVDLRNGFSGLSESERASAAASLAGQEAMSGLLAIVSTSDSDFEKLKSSIYNCDGATEKMAETMQDNLQGSLTIMKSAMEGFGIEIYEEMQEPLKEAADTGTEYINRLSDAFTSGGLRGVVKEAGEIFNDFADRIADTGEVAEGVVTPIKNVANAAIDLGKTAVPQALKTMETLAKNTDKVATVAVSAYTAFKGYKILNNVAKWYTAASAASKAYAAAMKVEGTWTSASSVAHALLAKTMTNTELVVGAVTTKMSLGTVATELYTRAQTSLNAALSANPIGLVVTAIAALAAGITAYAIVTKDAAEKAYGLNSEQKKSVEACEEVTEKLNEQRVAREESVQSIDKEYDGYEALLGELQSITDANGNVQAGYEDRAKVITGLLSDALGIEIEMLDGQIQKYSEVVQAIDEVIVKKKAEAVLSSMQDDMANAYANTSEAIDKYKDVAKAAADKTAELKAAQEEADAARQRYDNSTGMSAEVVQNLAEESAKADEKVRILTEAQKEAADAAQKSKNEMEALSAELENYNALNEAVASGDVAKIEEALNNLVTSYHAYTGEALAASEETRNAMYDQAQGYVENLGLIQDGSIKVADEIYAQMADAATKTIENFNQLPGGIARGIEDIGPEASGAMIAALAQADLDGKLGEEGKAALAALTEAFAMAAPQTAEEIRKVPQAAIDVLIEADMKGQLSEEASNAVHGMCEAISNAREGARNAALTMQQPILDETQMLSMQMVMNGQNAGAGFAGGVSSTADQSTAAGKENADAANAGASSTDLTPTGEEAGSQYASGVGSKTGEANTQGKALGDSANDGAGSVDGYTPGSDFGAGFVRGIGDWLGEAASAAANLALSAYEALRNALEEKSPSKKTKLSGKYFSQGLGIGIKENDDYAISAASEVAENALAALDMDRISVALKELDIPKTMTRINTAIDDKHYQVAERVIAATAAKEKSKYAAENAASGKFEIDYKQLEKAMSKRPIIVSATLNGRELIKMTAAPMARQMQENNDLKIMLNGGRT